MSRRGYYSSAFPKRAESAHNRFIFLASGKTSYKTNIANFDSKAREYTSKRFGLAVLRFHRDSVGGTHARVRPHARGTGWVVLRRHYGRGDGHARGIEKYTLVLNHPQMRARARHGRSAISSTKSHLGFGCLSYLVLGSLS
jgi:hypothetical protein